LPVEDVLAVEVELLVGQLERADVDDDVRFRFIARRCDLLGVNRSTGTRICTHARQPAQTGWYRIVPLRRKWRP
jgi:hypothetical protein